MVRPGVLLCSIILIPLFNGCGDGAAERRVGGEGPEELANLAIAVESSRSDSEPPVFAFLSDGRGSYWHDAVESATSAGQDASGLFARGSQLLGGWQWWMESDSTSLTSMDVSGSVVRPDFVVRSYVQLDTTGFVNRLLSRLSGDKPAILTEQVAMPVVDDTQAITVLSIDVPDSLGVVGFVPELAKGDQVQVVENVLLIERSSGEWLAIGVGEGGARGVRTENPGGPAVLLNTPGNILIAAAETAEDAVRTLVDLGGEADERRAARGRKLVERLARSPFVTEDERFNRAFQWALLTLDGLLVRDSSRTSIGLGLPDAEANASPGVARTIPALLSSGAWDDAREVLLSLAAAQRFDRNVDLLGRVPNAAPAFGEVKFLTADATPIFLKAAGDLVRTTGDRGLLTGSGNLWFKTVFALRGLYESDRRGDRPVSLEGFLTAREHYGTWADGASPRYGAPVEGQPALLAALNTAQAFAGHMGVAGRAETWYADTARVLGQRIIDRFVLSGNLLADHLDQDGSQVDHVGPSAVAALELMQFVDPVQRAQLARTAAEQLGLPHGITTRSQSADDFHPYLDGEGLYTEQDALFSGAVWTWLSGPMVSTMAQTGGEEGAYDLTTADVELLLERGTIGAIPELLSGHPRGASEDPGMGGALVQPFSLSGFVQAAYEGFLGVRYASESELVLEPRLPEAWGTTGVGMRLGTARLMLRVDEQSDKLSVDVLTRGAPPADARVRLIGLGREVIVGLAVDSIRVEITLEGASLNGEEIASSEVDPIPESVWDGFSWPGVALRDEYPVLQLDESQNVLEPERALGQNPRAEVILTQTDPSGDDWGATSTFTYPDGFEPGSLDGTYLEVARDDSTTYFRVELAAQPESGDLPILAIAIDAAEDGERVVGFGANYRFAQGRGYEYVILAGDGLRVIDASEREVGGLGVGHSILDRATGVATFAVPDFLIPPLERNTRVTVLIGAREASSGVGSFRPVAEGPGGDQGGGRMEQSSANVYDVISARVSR